MPKRVGFLELAENAKGRKWPDGCARDTGLRGHHLNDEVEGVPLQRSSDSGWC